MARGGGPSRPGPGRGPSEGPPGSGLGQRRVWVKLSPGLRPPQPGTSISPPGPPGRRRDRGCWAQRQALLVACAGRPRTLTAQQLLQGRASVPSSGLSPSLRPGSQDGGHLGRAPRPLGESLNQGPRRGGAASAASLLPVWAHCPPDRMPCNHFTPICSHPEDTRDTVQSVSGLHPQENTQTLT